MAEGGWHRAQTNRSTWGDRHGRGENVRSWREAPDPASHSECAVFEKALVASPLVRAFSLAALRAIAFPSAENPLSSGMGPPPARYASDQR